MAVTPPMAIAPPTRAAIGGISPSTNQPGDGDRRDQVGRPSRRPAVVRLRASTIRERDARRKTPRYTSHASIRASPSRGRRPAAVRTAGADRDEAGEPVTISAGVSRTAFLARPTAYATAATRQRRCRPRRARPLRRCREPDDRRAGERDEGAIDQARRAPRRGSHRGSRSGSGRHCEHRGRRIDVPLAGIQHHVVEGEPETPEATMNGSARRLGRCGLLMVRRFRARSPRRGGVPGRVSPATGQGQRHGSPTNADAHRTTVTRAAPSAIGLGPGSLIMHPVVVGHGTSCGPEHATTTERCTSQDQTDAGSSAEGTRGEPR